MNRKVKLVVASVILVIVLGINISYAISNSNSSSFFEVNKNEISKGETLEMTIDLSKIEYKQFEFVLSSNTQIDNISTDEANISLNQENNDIAIDINKEQLNINKIVLYYQIPENIEIGTKINLNAQIKIENDEIENEVVEGDEDWIIADSKQVEITIIEKDNKNNENNKNEENKNQGNNENNKQQDDRQNDKIPQNNNENTKNKMINNAGNVKNMSNNSSSVKQSNGQTEIATYNGSSNNYLSSLKINGVQLTTDFNKEKTTYFASVENMETIKVTANAEDSNSKVAITGTSLKSGENKVLISVTAENGDVRYYRIYVTKT